MALDNIEALADFDRTVSIKPEHAKVHELFGDAPMRTGKEEEAALQWAIAERLKKNAKRLKYHAVKLYEKNNNPKDLDRIIETLQGGTYYLSHRHHVCHRLSRAKRTCH